MKRCAHRFACLALAAVSMAASAQLPQSPQFVGPTKTPQTSSTQATQATISVPITSTTTTTAVSSLQRKFPQKALRGKIVFGTPPAVTLEGKALQMSPACRIHGFNNLLVLSGQLVGTQAIVDYTTDFQGQPNEIWILTQAEIANKPWPRTSAESAAWTFDAMAQTWTKP